MIKTTMETTLFLNGKLQIVRSLPSGRIDYERTEQRMLCIDAETGEETEIKIVNTTKLEVTEQ